MTQNEYYSGTKSVAEYLRPSADKMIPLVELPAALNPYLKSHDIHIDAKLMNTLPLLNVKSLPARHMLAAADVVGRELVEASSGNTVMSLGLLAPHFGVKNVTAIASPEVSSGKLALLRLAGVNVRLAKGPICPDPNDPDGAIAIARHEGEQPGKVNLGQYDNAANPTAHTTVAGPQLFQQLGDTIGMFCAGLGTTGTLLGTANYLLQHIPGLRVAGVVRRPNNTVPGVRTVNGLHEVTFDWKNVLNEPLVEVSTKEAYEASLRMIRQGLLVGPSSGFAFAGLLRHLKRMADLGELDILRGKHVVFICPDSPLPYVDEYEKVLDTEYFPAIQNAELRVNTTELPALVPELSIEELHNIKDEIASEQVVLIDVREPDEYADHHVPGSQNVPLTKLPAWVKTWSDDDAREVLFICRSGNRSARATHLARQMGLNAKNVAGGTAEWSAARLPRVTSPLCLPRAEQSPS